MYRENHHQLNLTKIFSPLNYFCQLFVYGYMASFIDMCLDQQLYMER